MKDSSFCINPEFSGKTQQLKVHKPRNFWESATWKYLNLRFDASIAFTLSVCVFYLLSDLMYILNTKGLIDKVLQVVQIASVV